MCSKSFEILRIHGKRSGHQNVFKLSRKKFQNIAYIANGDSFSYLKSNKSNKKAMKLDHGKTLGGKDN